MTVNQAKKYLFLFLLILNVLKAQNVNTENGWKLPARGELRVLVLFAEVEYDKNKSFDPYPNGHKTWGNHELPVWKDELFDFDSSSSRGIVTSYFNEMSFNTYNIYGDYYPELIRIKESQLASAASRSSTYKAVLTEAQKISTFKGNHSSRFEDFDKWDIGVPTGVQKRNVSNDKYDHIMIVIRNSKAYANGSGIVIASNLGSVFGHETDSYSVFGAGAALPFNILRHEYSHMLFGGNNFHCGGGQHHSGGYNHFIPFQGGWSMLGGYNSSFQTCNAWDRDRLGWKPESKKYTISALNSDREEVPSNLIANDTMQSIELILRDFIPTGDAVQIKLPYLSDDEYPQYLWLENHQTYYKNACRFDRFQYDDNDCVPDATPGIYAYIQVAHDEKTGENVFKGFADYLRNVPADGFYDIDFGDTLVRNNWCINDGKYYPYSKRNALENPLTGSGDQEEVAWDEAGDGKIGKLDGRRLVIEERLGGYFNELATLGNPRHAFTVNGNNTISMGSNPSSSNMITKTSYDKDMNDPKNNDAVVLNGLEVKLLENLPDGSIKIRISFNKTIIENNRRWASCKIVLPAINGENGYSLDLMKNRKIKVTQGYTATQVDNPVEIGGEKYFVKNTEFYIKPYAKVRLGKKSKLIIENNSYVVFEKGSTLTLKRKAKIVINNNAVLKIPEEFQSKKMDKAIKLKNGGKIEFY